MSDDNSPLAVWFPNPSCPKGCQKGGISEMPFVLLFLPDRCVFQARQRMMEHLIPRSYPVYGDMNLIVPRNHHTTDFRTVSLFQSLSSEGTPFIQESRAQTLELSY